MSATIVVPGIGGCELFTPPALLLVGRRLRIWLDYLSLVGGGWQLLALQDDGIHPDVPQTGEIQPGEALPEYYGTLIEYLARHVGYTVSARLDWRQTIARDAGRLVDQIRSLEPYGPVNLVGHSRGGLVARQSLSILSSSGELGRVGQCVSLGTPHYGSWAAVGMIAGWEATIGLLNRLLTGASAALFSPLLIRSVMRVVASWPAPYELFPSPAAPGISQGEVSSTYSQDSWRWTGSEARPEWIARAYSRWASVPNFPNTVDWLCVVGSGIPTPTRLDRLGRLDDPSSWSFSATGDGVVPAAWSRLPGRVTVTSPTGHSAMCRDPRVLNIIRRHLTLGTATDETIYGPVLDGAVLG